MDDKLIPVAKVLDILDECKFYSSNRVIRLYERIKFTFFKLSVAIVLSMMNDVIKKNNH